MNKTYQNLVIIRGAGDIATGTIQKLHRSGFRLLLLEVANPSAIRREVAFCEAIYRNSMTIEGSTAVFCNDYSDFEKLWTENKIPLIIDPNGESIEKLKPLAVIDAILAKKNLGTNLSMAPIVIGLGPGFTAGIDVDIVVETMRGHNLARLIFEGKASENTGIPGIIKGVGKDRVIYSSHQGNIKNIKNIGDLVKKGEIIATIDENPVFATIDGVLRGLIRDNFFVTKNFKIADIDPREEEQENCFTISDKARAIGGSVLEALLYLQQKKGVGIWKEKF